MSRVTKHLESRQRAMSAAADTLRQIQRQRESLNRQEADAVRVLRSEGISWRSIADLLGVSHESIRRRYGAMPKWGSDV